MEEKKQDIKNEETKKEISMDDLEKMSGGGGMRNATTTQTHDMPKGGTK